MPANIMPPAPPLPLQDMDNNTIHSIHRRDQLPAPERIKAMLFEHMGYLTDDAPQAEVEEGEGGVRGL